MRYIFSIIILMVELALKAQTVPDSLILYSSDFKFIEGIYPDFESVRKNSPIPKGRIISDYEYDNSDFFENLTSQNKIFYFDNLGNRLEIKTENIWGYSKNGTIYINVDKGFYRITLVGSICHFIAYQTTESYRSDPYYNPYYSTYPYYSGTPTTSTEMKQYLLDFNTGRILPYDEEGVEVLLMPDPELYDEFMQFSERKKKQMKFMYIRKFNQRNPLYLINNKH